MVPDILNEWFTMYSASRGSTRELLLISALTSTSALIGKTTVKVFGTYEELGNLFTIAVAPSGSGKTPACHLGCIISPIVGHIEPKINTNILIDVTSVNGIFSVGSVKTKLKPLLSKSYSYNQNLVNITKLNRKIA